MPHFAKHPIFNDFINSLVNGFQSCTIRHIYRALVTQSDKFDVNELWEYVLHHPKHGYIKGAPLILLDFVGACVDHRVKGSTPLMFAAQNGDREVIERLILDHDADYRLSTDGAHDRNVLYWANLHDHTLLKKKAADYRSQYSGSTYPITITVE